MHSKKIRELAQCVHLHDNFGRTASDGEDGDLHLLPFDGDIPFLAVADALNACGYVGTLMLETSMHNAKYEQTGLRDFAARAYAAASKLWDMTDKIEG